MKKSEFHENTPGKVIKTLHGYLAFIPERLPPRVPWSTKMITKLSEADRSLTKLAEVGTNFPAPEAILRPFVRKEAVLSSRIEGTHTSFQELLSYEAKQLSMFEDTADAREVHNYVKTMEYGIKRLESLPISMRLIRETHAELMRGVRGEYMTPGEVRRTQNWIGAPGSTLETARFVPPPVEEMHECLKNLERFIYEETEIPPLMRVGFVHYQFEAIHPFLDGNGRMGRLLITFLLVVWGLIGQPLLTLSQYFEAKRQEYYDRLLAVSQRGEWEGWLAFFLEGVRSQAEDAGRRVRQLQELRTRYRQRTGNMRSRKRLEAMMDYLIGTPITSVKQAQQMTKLGSFTTIQRLFGKLEGLGILSEATGKGRNRIYRAVEILKVLEEA